MALDKFSITLKLEKFFKDYRSVAKISINNDIKTVSDLEDKISRICHIKNFHLLCDNILLPSCEDICIINSGDSIWAEPNDESVENILLDEKYYVDNVKIPKNVDEVRSSKDEYPEKIKKCKKKKKQTILLSDEVENTVKQSELNSEGCSSEKGKRKESSGEVIFKKDILVKSCSTPLPDLFEVSLKQNGTKVNSEPTLENIEVNGLDQNWKKIKKAKKDIESPVVHHKTTIGKNKTCLNSKDKDYDLELMRNASSSSLPKDCLKIQEDKGNEDLNQYQNKPNLLTSLYYKKRKTIPWSTSPLIKSTNHIKITKRPCEKIDIDYSRFAFTPTDSGIIPVPCALSANDSTEVVEVADQILTILDIHKNKEISTSMNVSDGVQNPSLNINGNSTSTFISSDKLKNSNSSSFSFFEEDFDQQEKMPLLNSENVCNSSQCDKQNNCELTGIRGATIDVFNTKETDPVKLKEIKQIEITSNESKSTNNLTENIENNNVNQVNSSNQTYSEVKKFNFKSGNSRRKSALAFSGVSYYLKLLNDSGWDSSKPISNVNEPADNTQNSEIKTTEKLENDGEPIDELETGDSHSVSSVSTGFVTKRKRKRQHKKKVKEETPIPNEKTKNFLPIRSIPMVTGTPKIHIRFEEVAGLPSSSNTPDGNKFVELNSSDEKIKVLQNVSLDSNNVSTEHMNYSSMELEESLLYGNDQKTNIAPNTSSSEVKFSNDLNYRDHQKPPTIKYEHSTPTKSFDVFNHLKNNGNCQSSPITPTENNVKSESLRSAVSNFPNTIEIHT